MLHLGVIIATSPQLLNYLSLDYRAATWTTDSSSLIFSSSLAVFSSSFQYLTVELCSDVFCFVLKA